MFPAGGRGDITLLQGNLPISVTAHPKAAYSLGLRVWNPIKVHIFVCFVFSPTYGTITPVRIKFIKYLELYEAKARIYLQFISQQIFSD
jgi:hypothetical protein